MTGASFAGSLLPWELQDMPVVGPTVVHTTIDPGSPRRFDIVISHFEEPLHQVRSFQESPERLKL